MKNVYSVTQVNSYIKNMFSQDFMLRAIFVRGEVSNCKYHSSGHIYFTLKDENGTIACVMFAGNRKGLLFQMQEGQQVVVGGTVDVYERDGKYQLYAKQIVLDGAGLLNERFEQLKKELEERGMFAPMFKQPIPKFIKTLGIVTAPTGAAVQDIIQITKRRNPYVQIILYPAIVQGDLAAESIVNGIKALERLGVDVMIVGRGGGSMEDLWAFNEEIVAQAIFDCSVPIISAVGHETDTTIADYVSDMRAPTPSAGAELAVYDVFEVLGTLEHFRRTLNSQMNRELELYKTQVDKLEVTLENRSPQQRIREQRTYMLHLEESMNQAMDHKIEDARHTLDKLILQMKGLSPLDKLNQGYSFSSDQAGNTLTSITQVKPGQEMSVYVKDGKITATVVNATALQLGGDTYVGE